MSAITVPPTRLTRTYETSPSIGTGVPVTRTSRTRSSLELDDPHPAATTGGGLLCPPQPALSAASATHNISNLVIRRPYRR